MLARALLILFMFSYFIHSTSRFVILAAIRFEFLLGIMILLCILLVQYQDKWRLSVQSGKRLYFFLLYVFLSLPLVTWPGSVLRFHLVEWIKIAIFFIFIVTLIRSVAQLKCFFYMFMGTQMVRILEPLYLHKTTGYWGSVASSHVNGAQQFLNRLSGAPHDIVNPNQLAWVIVNMVPFIYFLLWQGGKACKIIALITIIPSVYALLLTGSRSGLLSLIFVFLTIIYFSRNRIKNFLMALVLGFPVAIFIFGILGTDLQTRYLSVIDHNLAGGDTAQGRIESLIRGVGSISNNPLFGNGLGTSPETNANVIGGRAQMTHNLYLEVFQEVGLIGFILFMMYIYSIIKSLMEAKNLLIYQGRDEIDWLYRFTTALQVWIVMDLFYSLSCFGLRSWEWYFFGAVSTVVLALVREQGQLSVLQTPS
ncbi:O-antigen ligase family protein [Desulfobulbus rhabdoformis]|uniref:O-antigen ligase family protein n=1 Tax=Desulfobulbus rhabdoformis TaxID=34032 RepID=UPI0019668A5F|nr:O-antigen ligase family protein [Desulfobulbus rhabdoformis]MBM9616712.1 O-antigen ligase family protein [Desulfobulbus rhabdoformis]